MFSKKHWQSAMVIIALVLALVVPASVGLAQSNSGHPGVFPADSHAYAQWSTFWWQWAYSIPWSVNPINDPTGANCNQGQSGPVWFLAGTSGGAATRNCTIPLGKAIFFPIINVNNDYPCPDPSFQPARGQSLKDFLTNGNAQFPGGAKYYIDNVTTNYLEVDSVPLQDYRATSSLFTFIGDLSIRDNFDPCVTGTRQFGVSDGYWIMLAPLSAGPHTIHFKAADPLVTLDVTYNLTVK